MKKKILSLCLVVALAATAVVGGTLAYFTDNDAKTNTFAVGNVNIHIDEWKEDGSDEDTAWDEYEDLTNLAPIAQSKAPFNKMVETVNDGDNDAYIRTFITCPADLYWVLGYGFNSGSAAVDMERPNVDGDYTMHHLDKWTDIGKTIVGNEEVYIFMCEHYEAISAGDSILSLTKVWIYENIDNEQIEAAELVNGQFNIQVYSEAIQADNLSYDEAMASLNAGEDVLTHAAGLFNN